MATKLPKYYFIVCLFFILFSHLALQMENIVQKITQPKLRKTKNQVTKICCCCCFSTGTLQGDECSRTGLCRYHPTAQLHLGSLREPWVTLLLHLYWRGCLIIHVSVELAGSYLEHVPCKFWKVCLGLKYLPQINYGGKLTCLGCSPRIGYH